jgi:hypothetical protein
MPFQGLTNGSWLAEVSAHSGRILHFGGETMPITFRVERAVGGESEIVLRVCGCVHIECVNTLKELIETESAKTVLDLS